MKVLCFQKVASQHSWGLSHVRSLQRRLRLRCHDLSCSALQQRLPSAPGSATPGAGWTEGPSVLSYLPSLLESVLTTLMVLVIFMRIERGVLRADSIEQVGTTLQETCDQVMQVSQRLASLIPHAVPRVS